MRARYYTVSDVKNKIGTVDIWYHAHHGNTAFVTRYRKDHQFDGGWIRDDHTYIPAYLMSETQLKREATKLMAIGEPISNWVNHPEVAKAVYVKNVYSKRFLHGKTEKLIILETLHYFWDPKDD